jgi:hypothetical protein
MSASTLVVSALFPVKLCEPGATGCDFWFSITVWVPSGEVIVLQRLFAHPRTGLRALADLVKRRIVASNRCVARFLDTKGIGPTWDHYRSWALTPSGLAIGFDTSQISNPFCGPVQVTVRYQSIRLYLSTLGKELVLGTRTPTP